MKLFEPGRPARIAAPSSGRSARCACSATHSCTAALLRSGGRSSASRLYGPQRKHSAPCGPLQRAPLNVRGGAAWHTHRYGIVDVAAVEALVAPSLSRAVTWLTRSLAVRDHR